MKKVPDFERLVKAAKFSARNKHAIIRNEWILINFIQMLSKRTGKSVYSPHLSASDLDIAAYRGQMKLILEYTYKMMTDKEIDTQQLQRRIQDIGIFCREFVYKKKSDSLTKWM